MPGTQKVFERYRTAGTRGTTLKAAWEGYSEYARLGWLPSNKDARILDLGCGAGEFLEYLAAMDFSKTEGIDYSPEQLAWCRSRGLERLTQVHDAPAFLRERRGQMACVVMNSVLEHIPKAEIIPLLETIRDTLMKGGSLLLQVPNMANIYGLAARYLDFTHEVGFTEHSIRQVLIAAGFEDEHIDVKDMPVRFKLHPKRIVFWSMNRLYISLHHAAYVAAVGADAPTIFSKIVMARATVSAR
jgi:2-polyprenyl-3-methyl-5-hydroxy-6-metoxy-1,4-benzoquinol methylase